MNNYSVVNPEIIINRRIDALMKSKSKIKSGSVLSKYFWIAFYTVPFLARFVWLVAITNHGQSLDDIKTNSGKMFNYLIVQLNKRAKEDKK